MAGCCDARGCDAIFGDRSARRAARRYRRRGLDATERRIVELAAARGLEGATVLEIGGGVGELHLELLRAGVSHATNLELVDAYDSEARRLADEAGLADRIDRRVVDIAAEPDAVEPADVVVLHRVVCCYPDVDKLLGAAADHARHLLVYSHPPRNVWTRAWFTVENVMRAAAGRSYRAFTHQPREMVATVQRHGMDRVDEHRGLAWHVVACERRTE